MRTIPFRTFLSVLLVGVSLPACTGKELTDAIISIPDLVPSYVLRLDHNNRVMTVCPVIKNLGGGEAKGPFKIGVAITLHATGRLIDRSMVIEVPANVTIAGATRDNDSDEFRASECLEHELVYRDQDDNARYDIVVVADHFSDVVEGNEVNNSLRTDWWALSPQATFPWRSKAGSARDTLATRGR